jgi:hypothetical protein
LNRRHFDDQLEKPSSPGRNVARKEFSAITIPSTTPLPSAKRSIRGRPGVVRRVHPLPRDVAHQHPAKIINGRRYYHTPAFRSEEQRFPRYQASQDWLDRVVRKNRELRAARCA